MQELLDAIAARTAAPGGGSTAACACAMAAALVEMATNFSSGDVSAFQEAGRLRTRALELADVELHAYEPVLAALRLPRDEPSRTDRIVTARAEASNSPLEIARVGAELAELAAELARSGNPNLAGDAIAGALLAEAGAQAAARLVEINLGEMPAGDARTEAGNLATRARAARDRALGAG